MEKTRTTFCKYIQNKKQPSLCDGKDIFEAMKLSKFCPENLAQVLGGQELKFRIGRKETTDVQWEGKCEFATATIEEFLTWHAIDNCHITEDRDKTVHNKFGACCKSHYWCYADYMYMKDMFVNQPEILSLLNWDSLGFDGKDGRDSTIWMGSEGAHTICHYDQYGFNIVMQVCGSKKWVLFPPSDSNCLYPTRIPFEESSIFSEVNVRQPDFTKHPRFRSSHACVVVLKPGDILYVPHHWWHFVENLELSVSINLWYDMENDANNRLTESITRLIVGSCLQSELFPDVSFINPTEDLASVKSISNGMLYLNQSLREVETLDRNSTVNAENNNSENIQKKIEENEFVFEMFQNLKGSMKITPLYPFPYVEVRSQISTFVDEEKMNSISAKRRKGSLAKTLCSSQQDCKETVARDEIKNLSFIDFVKCLTHADVIEVVSKLVLEKSRETSE